MVILCSPPFTWGGLSIAIAGGGGIVMLCSGDSLSASLALKHVHAQHAPERHSLSSLPSSACVRTAKELQHQAGIDFDTVHAGSVQNSCLSWIDRTADLLEQDTCHSMSDASWSLHTACTPTCAIQAVANRNQPPTVKMIHICKTRSTWQRRIGYTFSPCSGMAMVHQASLLRTWLLIDGAVAA
jgi:hypothetical protein